MNTFSSRTDRQEPNRLLLYFQLTVFKLLPSEKRSSIAPELWESLHYHSYKPVRPEKTPPVRDGEKV